MEELALHHGSSSNSRNDSGGKRKRKEKATIKPKKQRKQYSAEGKTAYKAKREAQKKGKGPPLQQGKIEYTDWNKAHEGIEDQVVQERKRRRNLPNVE